MSDPLGSIAASHFGKSLDAVLCEDGADPAFGTGGICAYANSTLFPWSIVVPRKGTLGKPWRMHGPCSPADLTYAVVPSPGTNIGWLFYNLLDLDLAGLIGASGVPSISRDWFKKIRCLKQDGHT